MMMIPFLLCQRRCPLLELDHSGRKKSAAPTMSYGVVRSDLFSVRKEADEELAL
jgi:hypothetical protein